MTVALAIVDHSVRNAADYFDIAAAIVREHPYVRDASVQLLSTIGRPADEPAVVAIALLTDCHAMPRWKARYGRLRWCN